MRMFMRYNLVYEEDLKGMNWIESKVESETGNINAKKRA